MYVSSGIFPISSCSLDQLETITWYSGFPCTVTSTLPISLSPTFAVIFAVWFSVVVAVGVVKVEPLTLNTLLSELSQVTFGFATASFVAESV